ncbi:hypothetical protein L6452_37305 [Arctium lappa]|uniref:Uncharacterized protein n=1 Tax=Arctium lappa TaxID=4217 RepID=A0ACB8Y1Y9_ARCLA|nr:hypothetical protein L6452_37305 [Arctium lappa]
MISDSRYEFVEDATCSLSKHPWFQKRGRVFATPGGRLEIGGKTDDVGDDTGDGGQKRRRCLTVKAPEIVMITPLVTRSGYPQQNLRMLILYALHVSY